MFSEGRSLTRGLDRTRLRPAENPVSDAEQAPGLVPGPERPRGLRTSGAALVERQPREGRKAHSGLLAHRASSGKRSSAPNGCEGGGAHAAVGRRKIIIPLSGPLDTGHPQPGMRPPPPGRRPPPRPPPPLPPPGIFPPQSDMFPPPFPPPSGFPSECHSSLCDLSDLPFRRT